MESRRPPGCAGGGRRCLSIVMRFRPLARCSASSGASGFSPSAALPDRSRLMHRELVETRGWLDEPRFLHALNFCMLLPGPEAMQLATYSGWLLRGVKGGLLAGLLFVLPGFAVIMALSALYFPLWRSAGGGGCVVRAQGRRAGDCCRGVDQGVETGAQIASCLGACCRGLRGDCPVEAAISADRAGGGPDGHSGLRS
jgi:hypothetical protein